MKYLFVILLSCALTTASAELTVEQQAKCEAEGGCLTMTREALLRALSGAHVAGRVAGRESAKVACWRDA